MRMRSRTEVFAVAAGFGGVLFIGTFMVLGQLASGYHSLRDTISALEFTDMGLAQRLNFLVFGLLLIAFAIALRRELESGRGSWTIPALQALAGLGVIGDAVFIHAPLHFICDLVAFNSSLLVLFLFAWRLRGDVRWKGWTLYSVVTAVVMMGFLTAFGMANHNGGPAGLMEKLASATKTLWSTLLVCKLLGSPQERLLSPSGGNESGAG